VMGHGSKPCPCVFAVQRLRYTATATVIDQFGASNSTSTTFSVAGGQVTPMLSVTLPKPAHTDQRIILQPMGTP
jgi:hypothetical protein